MISCEDARMYLRIYAECFQYYGVFITFYLMTMIGQLLGELPTSADRELFRRYEKVLRKTSKAEICCVFNQTCLNENLLPIY